MCGPDVLETFRSKFLYVRCMEWYGVVLSLGIQTNHCFAAKSGKRQKKGRQDSKRQVSGPPGQPMVEPLLF